MPKEVKFAPGAKLPPKKKTKYTIECNSSSMSMTMAALA